MTASFFHRVLSTNCSVRDIADAAGVQPAMINYYFRSKDELLYQAVISFAFDFFIDTKYIAVNRRDSIIIIEKN
jgi:AcrR family transcriptional regulator